MENKKRVRKDYKAGLCFKFDKTESVIQDLKERYEKRKIAKIFTLLKDDEYKIVIHVYVAISKNKCFEYLQKYPSLEILNYPLDWQESYKENSKEELDNDEKITYKKRIRFLESKIKGFEQAEVIFKNVVQNLSKENQELRFKILDQYKYQKEENLELQEINPEDFIFSLAQRLNKLQKENQKTILQVTQKNNINKGIVEINENFGGDKRIKREDVGSNSNQSLNQRNYQLEIKKEEEEEYDESELMKNSLFKFMTKEKTKQLKSLNTKRSREMFENQI